ncbi:MBL fold metallo-hydrolase [Desulfatitalea tepidiphila]|uniref:MBL fold metallo-hydrolase n=1 Tax=Desulfatitalea tepidiphila TaxID=1185843 RepID=UPI0006B42595|nr:MBL fold metallo-hydrolase [Desulfatitalea tepidiphila]
MRAVEILEDLFFIERGYLNANHFVYRCESPILIDTGYIADFDFTVKSIRRVGVDPADVSLIVNTHTHCDHIGGNRLIQERSGCGIALHEIGKHFIDTRDDWATWWRYYRQAADFFTATRALNDGDTVALGPHRFEVIYTPGHASDGIVLYNREAKLLISSDTLWENDMAVMTLRVEGSTAPFRMLDSLDRLAGLDVQWVYPGHGPPFDDMPAAIDRSREKLGRYLADRTLIGEDLLKKIIVYTLLMRKAVEAGDFFEELMATAWFRETVDLYFGGTYRSKYDEIMESFLRRGIVRAKAGTLSTTVAP